MTLSDATKRWLGLCYALTIFVSAFLLFQVQPLISKYILPWFGGTPAVWTTCMLFFQMVLFAGYAYAHVVSRRLSPPKQAVAQIVLILLAIATLPIVPAASWKPTGDEQPTLQIILLLSASVGLPFFVLSSTGPLLQAWFSRTHVGKSPYRLYALSNLGSLLALVTYPFAFEPSFELPLQAVLWSCGFVVYAAGCGTCALAMRKAPVIEGTATADLSDGYASAQKPSVVQCALWFALPMAASVMLLATTNQVCMDVAAVPFLWVVPLALYLLSFILCFDSDRWYSRWAFAIAMVGSMATVCKVLHMGVNAKIFVQIFVYFSSLFFCAMFCHGELVRLKPHPKFLTMFYLFISAGGAAGGLFVGVVAPYVFSEFLELPIGMVLCLALMCVVFWREGLRQLAKSRSALLEGWGPIVASSAAAVGLFFLASHYGWAALHDTEDLVSVSRNFYGVLRVKEFQNDQRWYDDDHRFTLTHGRILHGVQFASDEKRTFPTTYYVGHSGAGLALRWRNRNPDEFEKEQEVVDGIPLEDGEDGLREKPIRVGVVGLGTGTVAHYAVKGDVFCFYDINPRVIELSGLGGTQFTYLEDARQRGAEIHIESGDARLSMERQEPQDYDVIILDAFSSDAIPVHLLTVEAFEIYRKHLKPDGVLAVHISNRFFDLRPVVEGNSDELGLQSVDILYSVPDEDKLGNDFIDAFERSESEWVLVSPSPTGLSGKIIQGAASKPQSRRIVWTDDRNNLLEVMIDDPPHIELWNLLKQKWKDLFSSSKEESEDTEDSEGGS